jgi:hypothetical protein
MAATALMASASLYQGFAQSEAIKAQAEIDSAQAEINSKFAAMEAKEIIKQGDKASREHGRKVKQMVGSQRAAMAAQGIALDSGTALDIQEETATMGALDAQAIKNNAWRQSFGLTQESTALAFQARMTSQLAGQQARATLVGGALRAGAYGAKGAVKMGWFKGGSSGGMISTPSGYDSGKVSARNTTDYGSIS